MSTSNPASAYAAAVAALAAKVPATPVEQDRPPIPQSITARLILRRVANGATEEQARDRLAELVATRQGPDLAAALVDEGFAGPERAAWYAKRVAA